MARYFTPDTFAFLRDLAANNDRTWFNDNKARYEGSVRQPALDFITDYVDRLESLSPYFTRSMYISPAIFFFEVQCISVLWLLLRRESQDGR